MEKIKFLQQEQNKTVIEIVKLKAKIENFHNKINERNVINASQKAQIAETLSIIEKRITSIEMEKSYVSDESN